MYPSDCRGSCRAVSEKSDVNHAPGQVRSGRAVIDRIRGGNDMAEVQPARTPVNGAGSAGRKSGDRAAAWSAAAPLHGCGHAVAEEGMVASAVSAEPVSCINFPDTVPNTGNFSNLQGTERIGLRFSHVLSTHWVKNSLQTRTGNFMNRTGNSERVSGSLFRHQGFGSKVDFGKTTWMPLCWFTNWVTRISAAIEQRV